MDNMIDSAIAPSVTGEGNERERREHGRNHQDRWSKPKMTSYVDKCPHCGKKIHYCRRCGAVLTPEDEEISKERLLEYCVNCRKLPTVSFGE